MTPASTISTRHAFHEAVPHGFMKTQYSPASLCELGAARFRRELTSLPLPGRKAVITSLREGTSEQRVRYVLPTSLRHLIAA
jgi:hypothetical protein